MNNLALLPGSVDFEFSTILLTITSLLLIFVTISLIFSKTFLDNIIKMSIFSLLISVCYLLLDAPDVSMTEVALGACLSTCVWLNFISLLAGNKDNIKIEIKFKQQLPAIILCLFFIATLTLASRDLPQYGSPLSPLQTHVSNYYIENTAQDIGIPSLVAAILASYRGYDTLGETAVILIAGLGVLLIFASTNSCSSSSRSSQRPLENTESNKNAEIITLQNFLIIKNITLFVLPFIFLYALYIQINGEVSPGGGFQAGVIFASGIIGLDLIYGKALLSKYFFNKLLNLTAILGVLLYATTGLFSLVKGANYLNYYSLHLDKHIAQTAGIFSIELGVGITVSAVMCLIYSLFQSPNSLN